jgi:hypothetical protein
MLGACRLHLLPHVVLHNLQVSRASAEPDLHAHLSQLMAGSMSRATDRRKTWGLLM